MNQPASVELFKITHGKSKSRIYGTWRSMMGRCENKRHPDYCAYGARGIRVCERWRKFINFYADMGEKPSPNLSLDRINNDGNYEPSNCRWATPKEQARNKRTGITLIEYRGEKKILGEWAQTLGIDIRTLKWRKHSNWPTDRLLGEPVANRGNHKK